MNKLFRWIILGGIFTVLFASATIAWADDSYFIKDYFPTASNNHWYYDTGAPTETDRWIDGSATINDRVVWEMKRRNASSEFYSNDDFGLLLHSIRINESVFVIPDPLRVSNFVVYVGAVSTDQTTYAQDGFNYDYSVLTEVLGLEDVVSTNQVVFKNALKIRITTRVTCAATGYDRMVTTVNWYSKNLGLVQTTDVATGITQKISSAVTYYTSGQKKSELKATPDADGTVYFEYRDESQSRIAKKMKTDGSYIVIDQYWTDTAPYKIRTISFYSDAGVMLKQIQYHETGDIFILTIPGVARYQYDAPGGVLSRLTLYNTDDFTPCYFVYTDGRGEVPWFVGYKNDWDFVFEYQMVNNVPTYPIERRGSVRSQRLWSRHYTFSTGLLEKIELYLNCVMRIGPTAALLLHADATDTRFIIDQALAGTDNYEVYKKKDGTPFYEKSILYSGDDRPLHIRTYDAFGRPAKLEWSSHYYETYDYWGDTETRRTLHGYNPGGVEQKVFNYRQSDGKLADVRVQDGGVVDLDPVLPEVAPQGLDALTVTGASQASVSSPITSTGITVDQQSSLDAGDVTAGLISVDHTSSMDAGDINADSVTVQNGSTMTADSIVADSLVIGPGGNITVNQFTVDALTLNSGNTLTLNPVDRINGPTTVRNSTLIVTNANNLGSGQSLTIGADGGVVLSSGLSSAVVVGRIFIEGITPPPQQSVPATQTVIPGDFKTRLEMFRKMREERALLSRASMVTSSQAVADPLTP